LFVRQAYVETAHKMAAAELRPIVDLARSFAASGKMVIDSALAKNGLGGGKLEVYRALENTGVPVPPTRVLAEIDPGSIIYPKVLKWNFGFGAQHVFFVDSAARLAEIAARYPADELLVQEFIEAPREYKYIVVGFKALPVVVRYVIDRAKHVPDLDDFEVVQTTELPQLTKLMETAARVTERELCKIDVLEDASGRFYILEVNRWPGLKPFEEASGYNVAREFIKYIKYQKSIY